MSGDFDKSDAGATELTPASIASSEYFDHYVAKYAKQIKILDDAIMSAAKQGKSRIKLCVAHYQYGTDLEKQRARFHTFLGRFVEQFAYSFSWNGKLNDIKRYKTDNRTIEGKRRAHPRSGFSVITNNPIWAWYGDDGRRSNHQEYWDGVENMVHQHWTWIEPTADVNIFLTDNKRQIVRFWYGTVSW